MDSIATNGRAVFLRIAPLFVFCAMTACDSTVVRDADYYEQNYAEAKEVLRQCKAEAVAKGADTLAARNCRNAGKGVIRAKDLVVPPEALW